MEPLTNSPEIPTKRPYPPPRRVALSLALGTLGVLADGPFVFSFDVCFWIAGNHWLDLVFPYVVVVDGVFVVVMMQLIARLAFRWDLRALRAFRFLAGGLVVAFILVYLTNILQVIRASTDDAYAFHLIFSIILTAGAPFTFIFWRAVFYKYRWFDPKALPSELESDAIGSE